MKLAAAEIAYVRSQGLYITEKCDRCGKLLNQTFRYTIAGKPEAYCSAACRDLAFFGDHREARKHSTPGKCVYCGATLEGKRRGALYREAKARYMGDETVEGAEIAFAIEPTVENMMRRGLLEADALPLMCSILDMVCHDAPARIPWDRFFTSPIPRRVNAL
jgi:hypothetical protein